MQRGRTAATSLLIAFFALLGTLLLFAYPASAQIRVTVSKDADYMCSTNYGGKTVVFTCNYPGKDAKGNYCGLKAPCTGTQDIGGESFTVSGHCEAPNKCKGEKYTDSKGNVKDLTKPTTDTKSSAEIEKQIDQQVNPDTTQKTGEQITQEIKDQNITDAFNGKAQPDTTSQYQNALAPSGNSVDNAWSQIDKFANSVFEPSTFSGSVIDNFFNNTSGAFDTSGFANQINTGGFEYSQPNFGDLSSYGVQSTPDGSGGFSYDTGGGFSGAPQNTGFEYNQPNFGDLSQYGVQSTPNGQGGFNYDTSGLSNGAFTNGAQPVAFTDNPWTTPQIPADIPQPTPSVPLPGFDPESPLPDAFKEPPQSFSNPGYTPPVESNWAGTNQPVQFSDYINTGGKSVADAGLGVGGKLDKLADQGVTSPQDIKTPTDLATIRSPIPVSLAPGKQGAELPVSLSGGWVNGGGGAETAPSNFGTLSYGDVCWVNGNCTNIASEYAISRQEGGFVNFGPTPEQYAQQLADREAGAQSAPEGEKSPFLNAQPESVASPQGPAEKQTFAEWASKTWDDFKSGKIFESSAEAKPSKDVVQQAKDGETITGDASVYNPNRPGYKSGGQGLATGGRYDPSSYDAAIQTDIGRGVGCGTGNTGTCYALIEQGDKALIVKVNDNGPLVGNRIVDLNQKSMDYFTGENNTDRVLKDVNVTILKGDYTPGPVDGTTVNALRGGEQAPSVQNAGSDASSPVPGDTRQVVSGDINTGGRNIVPEVLSRGPSAASVRDINFSGLSTLRAVETGADLPDITPDYNKLIPTAEWDPKQFTAQRGQGITEQIQQQVNQEGQAAQLADRLAQAERETNAFNNPSIPVPDVVQRSGEDITAQINREIQAGVPVPDTTQRSGEDITAQINRELESRIPTADTSYLPKLPTQKEIWADLLKTRGTALEQPTQETAAPTTPVSSAELAAAVPEPVSQAKLAELVKYAQENPASTPDVGVPQEAPISSRPLTDAEIAARIPTPDTSAYAPSAEADTKVRSIFEEQLKSAQAQQKYAQDLLDRSTNVAERSAARLLLDDSSKRVNAIVDNYVSYASGNPSPDLRKAIEQADTGERNTYALLQNGIAQEKQAAAEAFGAMPKNFNLATAEGWGDLAKAGYYGGKAALYSVDVGIKSGIAAVGKEAGLYTPDQTTALTEAIDPIGSSQKTALEAANIVVPGALGAKNLAERGIVASIDLGGSALGRAVTGDVVSTAIKSGVGTEVREGVSVLERGQSYTFTKNSSGSYELPPISTAANEAEAVAGTVAGETGVQLTESAPRSLVQANRSVTPNPNVKISSQLDTYELPQPQVVEKLNLKTGTGPEFPAPASEGQLATRAPTGEPTIKTAANPAPEAPMPKMDAPAAANENIPVPQRVTIEVPTRAAPETGAVPEVGASGGKGTGAVAANGDGLATQSGVPKTSVPSVPYTESAPTWTQRVNDTWTSWKSNVTDFFARDFGIAPEAAPTRIEPTVNVPTVRPVEVQAAPTQTSGQVTGRLADVSPQPIVNGPTGQVPTGPTVNFAAEVPKTGAPAVAPTETQVAAKLDQIAAEQKRLDTIKNELRTNPPESGSAPEIPPQTKTDVPAAGAQAAPERSLAQKVKEWFTGKNDTPAPAETFTQPSETQGLAKLNETTYKGMFDNTGVETVAASKAEVVDVGRGAQLRIEPTLDAAPEGSVLVKINDADNMVVTGPLTAAERQAVAASSDASGHTLYARVAEADVPRLQAGASGADAASVKVYPVGRQPLGSEVEVGQAAPSNTISSQPASPWARPTEPTAADTAGATRDPILSTAEQWKMASKATAGGLTVLGVWALAPTPGDLATKGFDPTAASEKSFVPLSGAGNAPAKAGTSPFDEKGFEIAYPAGTKSAPANQPGAKQAPQVPLGANTNMPQPAADNSGLSKVLSGLSPAFQALGGFLAKSLGLGQQSQNTQQRSQPTQPAAPLPTTPQAPASVVTMVANPSTIAAGKSANLSWSAVGPTQCTAFDASGASIGTGNPNPTAQILVTPTATAQYKVTCTGGTGSANGQVTVTIQ